MTINISNIIDLQKIGNDVSYPLDGDYVQTQDIDASATSGWNGGLGFDPIGDSSTKFTGSYDGGGYDISNLFIDRPLVDDCGLFGQSDAGASISNATLASCNVTGKSSVGALVGLAELTKTANRR